MNTNRQPLNRGTFPGVPDSIADLWAKSSVADALDASSVEDVQAVLRGASAIVNAMGGGERFRVTLSGATSTAATDLKRRDVTITTAALADERLSVLERLAITSGMAQHEAGHGRLSSPMMDAVHLAFPQNVRAHRLSNIVEDVRLERASDERWPAYQGLFPLTLWWVANRHPVNGIDALPQSRAEAVNFCVAAARYSAHTVWGTDPAVRAERDWWASWAERAANHDDPAGHVAAIREALEHIEHLPDTIPGGDEPDGEPGEGGGEGEPGEGEPGGEGQPGESSTECTCGCSQVALSAPVLPGCTDEHCQCHGGQDEGTGSGGDGDTEQGDGDGEDADGEGDNAADQDGDGAGSGGSEPRDGLKEPLPLEIDEDLTDDERLNDAQVAQGLRSDAERRGRDEIVVTHPLIGNPDQDGNRERTAKVSPAPMPPAWTQKGTDPSVQAALRQAFSSRRTSHDNKSVAASGQISAGRLFRARTGVGNVFVRAEGISPDRLDLHLLVDASSSMGIPTRTMDEHGIMRSTGTRMSEAQTLCANMVEALLRMPNIRQHVWSFRDQGHTTHLVDVLDTRLHQPVERIRTIAASGGTPTGTAVRAIGDRVIAERKPRERSIIVVLTDGRPSEPAEWVRAAVNSLNDKGVTVLAVAISNGLTDSLRQCYGPENVVIWRDDWRRLGRELGQALGRAA